MSNIKMIVTDLDRTLLRKDKSLSVYTKSIINKCQQNGIVIVFATARPERATRYLEMGVSYVIANNGATVVSGGKCIKNISIPNKIAYPLITRFVNDNRITAMTVEVGDFLYTNDKEHKNWSFDADWNPVVTDFLMPVKEDIYKISVECDSPEIVLNIVRDYQEIHILPNSGEKWQLIMHCTSTKFNAILELSKLTGIPIKNIIAFGDDYNDVEMLKNCGVGVAVKNAVIDAKEVADFICDTNDNDGVAKYLEEYVLFEK